MTVEARFSPTAALDDLELDSQNVLDDYFQTTWHWRWSLGPYIIAETARSSIVIKRVEISQAVSPSFRARNMGFHQFEMQLFEPMGAKLYDQILRANALTGRQTLSDSPHILHLHFSGFSEDGTPHAKISNLEYNWQVIIQDVTSHISEQGSEYTIRFIPKDQVGTFDQYAVIPETINISSQPPENSLENNTGAPLGEQKQYDTVGKIVDRVVEILNKHNKDKYGTDHIKYQFEWDGWSDYGDPKSWKVVPDDRQTHSEQTDTGVRIAKNQDISNMIDNLIAQTKEGAQLASPSDDPSGEGGYVRDEIVVPRIETITDFDFSRWHSQYRDYAKIITFRITPFKSVRVIANQDQASEVSRGERSGSVAGYLARGKRAKKFYDYIFTGQNTSILKCDLHMNMMWRVMLDFFNTGRYYEMFNWGRQAPNDEWTEKINRTNPNTSNTDSGNFQSYANHQILGDTQTEPNILIEDTSETPRDYHGADSSLIPIQTAFRVDNPRSQVDDQSESRAQGYKSTYARTLEQLNSSKNIEFMSIDLEIRGDPYWIGIDNTTKITQGKVAPFSAGEICFMLRFNVPAGYNDDGSPNLEESVLYSGVYWCKQIISVFESNGQFTQRIQGSRLPNVNLRDMISSNTESST